MEDINIRVTDNISVIISNEGWTIQVYEPTDDDHIVLAMIRRVMEKYTYELVTPLLISNLRYDLDAEMYRLKET